MTKFPKNVILGYTKITNEKDFNNKNIPKLIISKNQDLVYASRSSIPFQKNYKNVGYRQVLAYCFPRDKLLKFSNQRQKTYYENIEDIEILRFLEIGIKVKMCKMSNKSISLDTKDDIKKVLKKIN